MKIFFVLITLALISFLTSCGWNNTWDNQGTEKNVVPDAPVVENQETPEKTQSTLSEVKVAELKLNAKIEGQEWIWKSIFNPPPYYSKWSRMMLSPDTPIFKMWFLSTDDSNLSFDLFWELKVWEYTWEKLNLVYQWNKSMFVHGTTHNNMSKTIKVEITEYIPNWNTATISGRISWDVSNTEWKSISIEWSFEKAVIDIWWEEAR